MTSIAESNRSGTVSDERSSAPSEDPDAAVWHAVHIRSRHEKLAAAQWLASGVPHWLPLVERRRRWTDRYVMTAEPLFPGYAFVHVPPETRSDALRARGVLRFVGFGEQPYVVPVEEVEAVRQALGSGLQCDPYPHLTVGREVEVIRGPLKGHRGTLVEKSRKHQLQLAVHAIGRAVAVGINAADVEIV